MANYYWIKLFIEILDDPKMGRLTEHQWNCAIKLFLLAGDMNQNGILPSVTDMAWRMRCPIEDLETDLADLAAVNITRFTNTGWIVTNFAKRQERISDADRMKQYRERKHKSLYYGDDGRYTDVTSRNADKESDIDKEVEEEKNAASASLEIPFDNHYKPPEPIHNDNIVPVKILCDASGLSDFPGDMKHYNDIIYSLAQDHGIEATTKAMKQACAKWIITVGKNGRTYRKTNLAWINNAQEILAGGNIDAPPKDPSKMTDAEYTAWLLAKDAEHDRTD
jgi:hypothetical protein